MFEHSLLTAGPAERWPMYSSLMLQAAGVGGLLLVPLIWIEKLPELPPLPPMLLAPRAPKPIPVFTSGVIRSSAQAVTVPRPFTAPPHIPKGVSPVSPKVELEGVNMAVNSGPVGVTDGLLPPELGVLSSAPPPKAKPEATPEPPRPAAPTSMRVHSDVQASKLIHQVKPPYPPLARQTHTQGVVKLHAVIARDGTIQQLQVLAGHPLLVQAAVEAVRQWRYSPTLLNGQPVEVVTQIDVNFVLGR